MPSTSAIHFFLGCCDLFERPPHFLRRTSTDIIVRFYCFDAQLDDHLTFVYNNINEFLPSKWKILLIYEKSSRNTQRFFLSLVTWWETGWTRFALENRADLRLASFLFFPNFTKLDLIIFNDSQDARIVFDWSGTIELIQGYLNFLVFVLGSTLPRFSITIKCAHHFSVRGLNIRKKMLETYKKNLCSCSKL